MRTFANVLIMISLACLLTGAVTSMLSVSSGGDFVSRFQEVRQVVEENVDEAKDVMNVVDDVFQESQSVVDDYTNGEIDNVHDDRIWQTFAKIKVVLKRSDEMRGKAREGMKEVEAFKSELEVKGANLAGMAAVSAGTLVLSGWLLAFGIWANSATKRREYERSL